MREFQFLFLIIAVGIYYCVDSAMVLSEGEIIAKGTPQELVRNNKAIEAYFGEGFKI